MGFCKHDNEHSYSIKYRLSIEWLSDCQRFNNDSGRMSRSVGYHCFSAFGRSCAKVLARKSARISSVPPGKLWYCRGLFQIRPWLLRHITFKSHYSLICLLQPPSINPQMNQHRKKYFAPSMWLFLLAESQITHWLHNGVLNMKQ
jgi:hypothetical protein